MRQGIETTRRRPSCFLERWSQPLASGSEAGQFLLPFQWPLRLGRKPRLEHQQKARPETKRRLSGWGLAGRLAVFLVIVAPL